MKLINKFVLILALLSSGTIMAQGDAVGTWQGDLTLNPEFDLSVQFIISQDDNGNFVALINSPNNQSINNISADVVNINGTSVSLEFESLSGSYTGEISAGTLTGEWSQLSDSYPLVLTPYVESELSAEDLEMLVGVWSGEVSAQGNTTVIALTFEIDDEGVLSGSLGVPAQGVSGIPLADIAMVGSQFKFAVPQAQIQYEGEFTEEGIVGTWSQGEMALAVTFVKGEGVLELTTTFTLTEDEKEALLGTWSGQLGALTIEVHFERDENGEFISYGASPTQGATNLPITEVSLLNGQLKVVVALGAEFNGELNGDEVVGTWTQGGMTNPLTLVKGGTVMASNLSTADEELLLGTWTGILETLNVNIVLRFERDDTGTFISLVDSPDQGALGLVVNEVNLANNQLKVVLALGAEFNGEIQNNEIIGTWSQGGGNLALTVVKD